MRESIELKSCYKGYTVELDKVCPPEETVARFQDKLKKVNLDILAGVERVDNGRLGIPVYFSLCGDDARELTGNKKQMGKGATPAQAKASACMELAERFSLFSFRADGQNFGHGTWQEMEAEGYPLLPVEQLLLSVHDESTDKDKLLALLAEVKLTWVWALDMASNEKLLLPFSWFYAINEFNGSAAGNSVEEAASQGLAEVIERHLCAEVSWQKKPVPLVDPLSVENMVARDLLTKFKMSKIELKIYDFSLSLGVPTIAVMAWDPVTFPQRSEIVYTAGTSPNPDKALIRALTEVAQLAGDFNSQSNYIASGLEKPSSFNSLGYLDSGAKQVDMKDLPDLSHDNIKVEIDNMVNCLQKQGLSPLLVDISHPALQIPAVYTIVPGTHFRERSRSVSAGLFAAKLVYEGSGGEQDKTRVLLRMQGVDPSAYYLEFYLGRLRSDEGELEAAVTHYKKALAMQPAEEDIPYIHSYLGDCLKDMENFSEAVSVLEKGRVYDDERPDFHNILGVCYFKLGKYEEAIERFQRAVELVPSSAIDYANLGVNYRRLGNNDEAVKYFELALELDESIEFAREQLAELLAE